MSTFIPNWNVTFLPQDFRHFYSFNEAVFWLIGIVQGRIYRRMLFLVLSANGIYYFDHTYLGGKTVDVKKLVLLALQRGEPDL